MSNNLQNKIAVFGINHRSAPIEERELYQITRKEIPAALRKLSSYIGVQAVLILSTCNRLELYMLLNNETNPIDICGRFFLEDRAIDINYKRRHFYTKENAEAVKHLFRVIAGLDSLVLGEYQIQGQIREAYSIACEHKSLEKVMHKLFHAAFRAGKKVRSQTEFGNTKQSVSGVASEILIQSLKHEQKIAIIGVNENTRIIADSLTKVGFSNLIFTNRTLYKAEMMAAEFGGRTVDFNNLDSLFTDVDAVFSCTGAPGFILPANIINRLNVMEQLPKLIIDMAVPRDIEIENTIPGTRYYNINDLQNYLLNKKNQLLDSVPAVEKIIDDELSLFLAWSETQSNEILEPYAEKFELIRQQVLDENRKYFPTGDIQHVEKLTRHLLHRLQSTFVRVLVNTSSAANDGQSGSQN